MFSNAVFLSTISAAELSAPTNMSYSLIMHTMDEKTLIQNTVENNHIEAVTESSDVSQSEVPSEAGGRVVRC